MLGKKKQKNKKCILQFLKWDPVPKYTVHSFYNTYQHRLQGLFYFYLLYLVTIWSFVTLSSLNIYNVDYTIAPQMLTDM